MTTPAPAVRRAFVSAATVCSVLVPGMACSPRPVQVTPENCAPVAAELPSEATAEGLTGEYRLRLVATAGPGAGNTADGLLRLQPYEGALRHSTHPLGIPDSTTYYPLFGSVSIDLAPVGAVTAGDLQSLDPMRPGVAVVERHGGGPDAGSASITIRLGSEANRRDVLRFDGGYTALRVRRIADRGFAGSWVSGGAAAGEQSQGYFCAVEAGP